ncbi:hypothetical protein H1Z61_02020 [Bacillus aquiflavi]|uniref:Uncharacterized protein n=1 Tax=Bacillus aquiflavi TaxID=2672567 RepID=A0A6B3VVK7_9BACI|nr:hypothetical protein [Bacillus aquiflavi]MBA4535942.1 hypothetical protein [Bacillus aquiflavi]NEY80317.1 hypothetical protein [Bacillus aquiflavi]UAC49818.1 hypothetical protein K6959_08570 [Bacillus aquiflavi]
MEKQRLFSLLLIGFIILSGCGNGSSVTSNDDKEAETTLKVGASSTILEFIKPILKEEG